MKEIESLMNFNEKLGPREGEVKSVVKGKEEASLIKEYEDRKFLLEVKPNLDYYDNYGYEQPKRYPLYGKRGKKY